MTALIIFLISIIQGITEFLPISSSGHLVLLPALSGLVDQGQTAMSALILAHWPPFSFTFAAI